MTFHHPAGPADTVSLRSRAQMPVLGLGTWHLSDTANVVQEAIEAGYRLIDTSGNYGTQPGIAEALRRTDVPRDDLYLVTKVEEHEDPYEAAGQRLEELDVDQVDLMLVHWPPVEGAGVELWRGLLRARDEGLATDVGVSNYTIEQIDEVTDATGEAPAVDQLEWSPFGWSPTMLEECTRRDIVIQAYSPLTRGDRLDDEVVGHIAAGHGKSPAQVLLRWDLQRGVVPLPKANRRDHVHANLDVFDFELSESDVERLDSCNEHYSALGSSLAYV